MPENTESVETVGHAEEARRQVQAVWERAGSGEDGTDAIGDMHLREAQIHASLAIAEELREANEARRERRASAVEALRDLVDRARSSDGFVCSASGWKTEADKVLAQFEGAEHA